MLTALTEAHSRLLTGALDVVISCGEADQFQGQEVRVRVRMGGGHPHSMKRNLASSCFYVLVCLRLKHGHAKRNYEATLTCCTGPCQNQ